MIIIQSLFTVGSMCCDKVRSTMRLKVWILSNTLSRWRGTTCCTRGYWLTWTSPVDTRLQSLMWTNVWLEATEKPTKVIESIHKIQKNFLFIIKYCSNFIIVVSRKLFWSTNGKSLINEELIASFTSHKVKVFCIVYSILLQYLGKSFPARTRAVSN